VHAHTQILGKLAATLAPPEPQLQHAALRLSGRGWETLPLPAPDGSGALVVALDLHRHEAVAEHTDGRTHRIPLAPDRPVADVTGELLAAVADLVGPVRIDTTPQETPWTVPLDEDDEHHTYDRAQVSAYFTAATPGAPRRRDSIAVICDGAVAATCAALRCRRRRQRRTADVATLKAGQGGALVRTSDRLENVDLARSASPRPASPGQASLQVAPRSRDPTVQRAGHFPKGESPHPAAPPAAPAERRSRSPA
jgi:hypothetical protein